MRLATISLTARSTKAVEIGSPFRRRAAYAPVSLFPLEVGQQLADMALEAPDTSLVAYLCTLCPAAQGRELAPASRPAAVPQAPFRALQSANRLVGQVWVGHAKTTGRLQRMLEARGGVPPVQHARGIRQRLALQPPQPGVAVAQHCRRRVRGHARHCERLLERTGCNRGAVAREGKRD